MVSTEMCHNLSLVYSMGDVSPLRLHVRSSWRALLLEFGFDGIYLQMTVAATTPLCTLRFPEIRSWRQTACL